MVTAVEIKLRPSEPSHAGLEPSIRCGAEPDAAERATFVLAIFPGEPAASDAIRHLTTSLGSTRGATLVSCPDFRGSIAARPPFDTLWASLSEPEGAEIRQTPGGTQRLAQHLTRRLADGASVVIVKTKAPEQRLAVSRTLLEAGCEMLLTHEATLPGSGTIANHPRAPVMKP